jgi:phosphoribulokinase
LRVDILDDFRLRFNNRRESVIRRLVKKTKNYIKFISDQVSASFFQRLMLGDDRLQFHFRLSGTVLLLL